MTTSQFAELPAYDGVATRVLRPTERPFPTPAMRFPLVLEAKGRQDIEFLCRMLQTHSTEVTRSIHEFGAILLRGFDIRSERAFASVITSIRGLRPMSGYFMAEPGRALVSGSSNVFHTNTFAKTGGSFSALGDGFHSENYYSLDVPAFQSFWCKRRPWLGGETALVHSARAYAELSEVTKGKLEAQAACNPAVYPVSLVARMYGRSEDEIEAFFRQLGLSIATIDDRSYIVLQKPSIYLHPHTRQATLVANLSGELPDLRPALEAKLAPHYAGWKWSLHRVAWSHPAARRFLSAADNLPTLLRHNPRHLWMRMARSLELRADRRTEPKKRALPEDVPGTITLEQLLTTGEVKGLAEALWKQCSVFSWMRGDVLIWDNLQVLHSGMPGLGPRELRVMLCNPVSLRYPVRKAPAEPVVDGEQQTIDARLRNELRA